MYFPALIKKNFFLNCFSKYIINKIYINIITFSSRLNSIGHSKMCVSYCVCVIYEIAASTPSVQDAEETDQEWWSIFDQIKFWCPLPLSGLWYLPLRKACQDAAATQTRHHLYSTSGGRVALQVESRAEESLDYVSNSLGLCP